MKHTHTRSGTRPTTFSSKYDPQTYASPVPSHRYKDAGDGLLAITHFTLQSHQRAELIIHADDLHFYELRVWQIGRENILKSGYARNTIRLHRLIVGAAPGERVFFANGNTLDFRRENLIRSGHCRNFVGSQAPGVYPKRKTVDGELQTVGVRTFVSFSRGKKLYREFCFEKYGMQGAMLRALAWRVNTLREGGIEPSNEMLIALDRARRMARAGGGFEELYGGNAEYEDSVVVGTESSFQVRGFDYGQAA